MPILKSISERQRSEPSSTRQAHPPVRQALLRRLIRPGRRRLLRALRPLVNQWDMQRQRRITLRARGHGSLLPFFLGRDYGALRVDALPVARIVFAEDVRKHALLRHLALVA